MKKSFLSLNTLTEGSWDVMYLINHLHSAIVSSRRELRYRQEQKKKDATEKVDFLRTEPIFTNSAVFQRHSAADRFRDINEPSADEKIDRDNGA